MRIAPRASGCAQGSQTRATALVLGGIVSVQIGAAFATTLFDDVGPGGTVFLRIGFAALILLAVWRPALRLGARVDRRSVLLLGGALAAMNLSFYAALDRIPLGIAVTLEFVGPLGVAILASRRRLDLIWVGLAIVGLVLLAPFPGSSLDGLGCVLALVAGLFWGAYIMLTARVGQAFAGGAGLAIAMTVAAAAVIPAGVLDGGAELLDARILAIGLAVALLSSVVPYSLEMEALRRLPEGTFGVLMSLEPAVAATVGFVGLDQGLEPREIAAIALVLAASIGALRAAGTPRAAEA
ncbi:MAG: EamA family transporter [Actinomycetota bacterium]|nr:EamA family transporter [Actinomycetota bacterium]